MTGTRSPYRPPHRDDACLERSHRQAGHRDQLVRGLKGVEHGGQAEVEHVVEYQDIDAHGKYGPKYGILAYGKVLPSSLSSA